MNSTIIELDLSNKNLTKIPDLSIYPNLIKLNISKNKIKNLDNLPQSLQILNCGYNKITQLDNLPHNRQFKSQNYKKVIRKT